jgi:peroxiredoxin
MKKITFVFALTFALSSVFAQSGFQISGKINGLGDESVVLSYRFDGTAHADTITAKNDVISFKKDIKLPNPISASLRYMGAQRDSFLITSTNFFIDNGVSIVLDGDLNNLYDLKATNSPFFDDVLKLREENKGDAFDLAIINLALSRNRQTISRSLMRQMRERSQAISARTQKTQDNFIENNKSSVYAGFLYAQVLYNKDIEALEKAYNNFTNEVKNSVFGKQIHTELENKRRLAPGMPAPNFTQKDIDGKTVSLSQFKGKYVLLVFWGSWCGPCRMSHPHMMEQINKYKDSPLQVIGLARDEDRDAWKAAIEKDELDFIHINLLDKLNGEDVVKMYNIPGYPTKVFIDPQGKIVSYKVGHNNKDFEEMLEKAFEK